MIANLKEWTKRALRQDSRTDDDVRAELERRRAAEIRAELERLRAAPRYTPLSSDLLGPRFDMVDGASFCACYEEIFGRGIYAFEPRTTTPFIIDGGANIGVSVAYFKQAQPGSRIIAFEPDPHIFQLLQANVRRAGYDNVDLINKALWNGDTEIEFWSEGADAGRISRRHDDEQPAKSRVPAVRLRPYLMERVDFLKLDIEGAELEVLSDCADLLSNVRHLFVEYHSFVGEEQRLDALLRLLKSSAFRVYIQTAICPPQPFLATTDYVGMDLQLNVFATRAE
jgi:FkbM family methyltransferase